MHGLWIHPLIRHIMWGGALKTTACGAHSLWGHGPSCGNGGCGYRGPGMVEEAKVLLRRTETRRRKRHRLLYWRFVPHM